MRILMTGGTGQIGSRLLDHFRACGHEVSLLTRRRSLNKASGVKTYVWSPTREKLPDACLKGIDAVVHLCGAGVARRPWTRRRKAVLWRSRVDATRLLVSRLCALKEKPKVFVGASAVGYYGWESKEEMVDEDAPCGDHFLGRLVAAWETEAAPLSKAGIRVAHMRLGIVLDPRKGMLPQLFAPIKCGLGVVLGSGHQWINWAHYKDVCHAFEQAITLNSWQGAYNVVAPEAVTYQNFIDTLARLSNKKIILPRLPAWLLKVVLGEMSTMVLKGKKVHPKRLLNSEFTYTYADWAAASTDLGASLMQP